MQYTIKEIKHYYCNHKNFEIFTYYSKSLYLTFYSEVWLDGELYATYSTNLDYKSHLYLVKEKIMESEGINNDN